MIFLYKCGDQGTEILANLLKVTQLVSDADRSRTGLLTQSMCPPLPAMGWLEGECNVWTMLSSTRWAGKYTTNYETLLEEQVSIFIKILKITS